MIISSKRICITGAILYGIMQLYMNFNSYNMPAVFKISFGNIFVQDHTNTTTKYILYWSPFLNNRWDYYWGYGYEPFRKCENYSNCFTTKNRSAMPLEKFDAIIFHAFYNKNKHGVPSIRRPNQIYVHMNLESPGNMPWLKFDSYKSFFNWTMTYRLDSDIAYKYGYIIKNKTNYNMPSVEFLKNKTGAAWFVSHCKTSSKREILVNELQRFYNIDIYGKCGNMTCHRKDEDKCYRMVEQKYKYYLSFENSYCKDYITEKLYNILRYDIVPIVYSGGVNDVLVPSGSIINVEDFKNPRQLADYLKYLDNNLSEYSRYFEWKKEYVLGNDRVLSACDLCTKLHQPLKTSIHEGIDNWWKGDRNNSVCKGAKNLPRIVSDLVR